MRFTGNNFQAPVLPDTVLTVLLTAATQHAFDYPAGCDLVRVSAGSTIAGFNTVYFNPSSTLATLPTTAGTVATTAAGLNVAVSLGDAKTFTRPRTSTGFSLIAVSSLACSVEFWSRGSS